METVGAIVTSILALVLWWLRNREKTKLEKAQDAVRKARARTAQLRFLAQTKQYHELENMLDRQDADFAALLGMRGKAPGAQR